MAQKPIPSIKQRVFRNTFAVLRPLDALEQAAVDVNGLRCHALGHIDLILEHGKCINDRRKECCRLWHRCAVSEQREPRARRTGGIFGDERCGHLTG